MRGASHQLWAPPVHEDTGVYAARMAYGYPALVMPGTDRASPKLKPQFEPPGADFVVYPHSVKVGKQHHPLPEALLRGGAVV